MEYVCLVLGVLALVMYVLIQHIGQQNTLKFKQTYADSLDRLRSDPTNPKYHEQALQAGRQYAAITRNTKSVTLFDETALANDIRAVTANASRIATVRQQQPPTKPTKNQSQPDNQSIAERIAALKTLKEADMISDEEYESKRKAILDSI